MIRSDLFLEGSLVGRQECEGRSPRRPAQLPRWEVMGLDQGGGRADGEEEGRAWLHSKGLNPFGTRCS